MAVYKIIQDIEAQDQLVWRLDLRQFIYAVIAALLLFGGWMLGNRSSPLLFILMIILALPFVFLALPLNRDQPNDVWLLARLNFLLRPKLRLWSQIGDSYKFLIVKEDSKEDANQEAPAGPKPEEIGQQIKNLGDLLDSRGHSIQGTDHLQWEHEHERRHGLLGERFQKLLSRQQQLRRNKISQHFNQKLKKQLQGLGRPSKPRQALAKDQVVNLKKGSSSDTIELDKIQDLKIATLEQMVDSRGLRDKQ